MFYQEIKNTGLFFAAIFTLSYSALSLATENYPSRPIEIVVPYAAGSSLEVVARSVGDAYVETLGEPAIIINMPGASGSIGARHVAKAKADGQTLLLGTNQTHGANTALFPNLPYDAIQSFEPIVRLGRLQHVLVVRKGLDVKTVDELIDLLNSGKEINYGSSGNGSASHLAAEMFQLNTNTSMQHIPYKGSAEVVQAVIGEHVDLTFSTVPTVLQQIRNGNLVALGIASKTKSAVLPTVSTLESIGVLNVEADAWAALFAPVNTPEPIINKLAKSTLEILQRPAIQERIEAAGFIPDPLSTEEFSTFMIEDMNRWSNIIQKANVKVD